MSLIEELKRRKVFRVAASYAVVAFIIFQLVEILFPIFNFPQWTQQFVVIVILLGFPIALIFSWVFDKTPEGFIKTDAVKNKEKKNTENTKASKPFYLDGKNLYLLLGLVIAFLLGSYGSGSFQSSVDDKSIAVLPFDNFSKSDDDQFFSDGITEDITMNLAKVKDLTVISRTSVMGYKGTTKNIKQISDELGVKYILEGSVRKLGDRVRIVGQLIDARQDKHIWSDSYDREMSDLFLIQADVSEKIAQALEAELSDNTLTQINEAPTQNIDAYMLYQRARNYYGMYTASANESAISLFKEALKLDKTYALSYAGLADSYAQRVIRSDFKVAWLDSALNAANIALKMNSNLAEAFKAKGLVYFASNNIDLAELNNDKALEINPGYYQAVANKGIFLNQRGQLLDSYKYLQKAIRINPISTSNEMSNLVTIFKLIGEEKKSNDYIFNTIKNSPNVVGSYRRFLTMFLRSEDFSNAKKIINLYKENIGDSKILNFYNALYSYYEKNFSKSLTLIKESGEISKDWSMRGVTNFSNAHYYVQSLAQSKNSYKQLLNDGIKYTQSRILDGANTATIFLQYSALLCLQSDFDNALKFLEKSVQSGLRDRTLLEDLAYEKLRNNDRFNMLLEEIDVLVNKEKLKFKENKIILSDELN